MKKANGIFLPLQSVPNWRNPEMGRHIVVRFLVNSCVSCPATKAICSIPRQWLYMAVALIQTGNGMVWMSQCYQNVRVRSMSLSLYIRNFLCLLAYSRSTQKQKTTHPSNLNIRLPVLQSHPRSIIFQCVSGLHFVPSYLSLFFVIYRHTYITRS